MKTTESAPKIVRTFEGKPQPGNSQRPTTPQQTEHQRSIPDVGHSQRPVTPPPSTEKGKS